MWYYKSANIYVVYFFFLDKTTVWKKEEVCSLVADLQKALKATQWDILEEI